MISLPTSLYEEMKAKVEDLGISMNEYINQLIENDLAED